MSAETRAYFPPQPSANILHMFRNTIVKIVILILIIPIDIIASGQILNDARTNSTIFRLMKLSH